MYIYVYINTQMYTFIYTYMHIWHIPTNNHYFVILYNLFYILLFLLLLYLASLFGFI